MVEKLFAKKMGFQDPAPGGTVSSARLHAAKNPYMMQSGIFLERSMKKLNVLGISIKKFYPANKNPAFYCLSVFSVFRVVPSRFTSPFCVSMGPS